MAMTLPGRGGGRFGPALSDINVTPLVDVILVLLIIFMVTAPMMSRGIDIRLPKTESGTDATEQRLVVTVDKEDTVYLNDRPVAVQLLTDRLRAEIKRTGNDFVFLRADQEVPYGRVMLVMDQIKKAGADRVGMVTQPAPPPPTRRRGRSR
ncbi:MAG TPA: biopolymer transporter ExbD [Candidatus Polarisedimenticolia bacterium]|nr:biopolymer transporter ExbD [Candidatus Polarisedimenticolia bacterium]